MNTIKIDTQGVRLVAHRGLSGIEPENTHAAFIAAANRSYHAIETDVHVTRDGHYICTHDDTTGRVAARNLTVENTDYEELRQILLHEFDGSTGRTDLRLPSLEEYARICQRYEKTSFLELKNRVAPVHIQKIITLLRRCHQLDHTVFISFDRGNLIDLRAMLPSQPMQYLCEKYSPEVLQFLKQYQLDLDISSRALTAQGIEDVHQIGQAVNVWTINDAKSANYWIAQGVDYITTNILEQEHI